MTEQGPGAQPAGQNRATQPSDVLIPELLTHRFQSRSQSYQVCTHLRALLLLSPRFCLPVLSRVVSDKSLLLRKAVRAHPAACVPISLCPIFYFLPVTAATEMIYIGVPLPDLWQRGPSSLAPPSPGPDA